MLEREPARCPGCNGRDGAVVYEARDEIYHVDPRPYPLVRCDCGLVYLGQRPTRSAIADAYPPTYLWRQARTRGAGSLNEHLVALYFRQFYSRRAKSVLPLLPEHPRVVDLGCGEGLFLEALAARRPGSYLGLDFVVPDAPGLVAADLNSGTIPGGPWDMVTLWHVLEHLYDPRAALKGAYEALAPGGWLVVATQNFDALSRRLMGPRWPLNDVPRHLMHFTPETLAALVGQAGFAEVQVRHLTEYFPVLGGHLLPHLTVRADGSLRAAPGLVLSALGAPLELAAIAGGRGCTFNLLARRPAAAPMAAG